MSKAHFTPLTLCFTTQHLVLHLHCILYACLQQNAQTTNRFLNACSFNYITTT
jgi:hypothetical protein